MAALGAAVALLLAVVAWHGAGNRGGCADVPVLPSEMKCFADSVAAADSLVAVPAGAFNESRPAASGKGKGRGGRPAGRSGKGAHEPVADRRSPLDEPVL